MFYVYILQSQKNNSLYIGKTNDLKRRVTEHNQEQNLHSKKYTPWDLIFYEAYSNENDAKRRERYLKTTQGHMAIRRMLKEYLKEYSNVNFEYQGSTT